jgi:uncharacterized protein (DUF1684 family)
MDAPQNAENLSPDDEVALEAQQWLLETSLPLAFSAYDEGLAARMRDPVVFLLDCEDAVGNEIARSWLGDQIVEDAISDRDEDSETTVFAYAFPFAKCRTEVPAVFPYLQPAFDCPPADGFLAISVTAGGASALTVPFDARE